MAGRKNIFTYEERLRLSQMYQANEEVSYIAVTLGRSTSGIYDEINRGFTGEEADENYRKGYDPELGERTYRENLSKRRRKQTSSNA